MELNFYLEESKINPSLIKEKWIYPAGSGFNPDTRRVVSGSGNDPFSLLFTFNRTSIVRGTIFSNYESGRGVALGFTDNNELFCSSSGEFYIFHNLRLGSKNCLGITRQGATITAYKYDVLSSGLNKTESYQFSNLSNLSGGEYAIGRNTPYLTLHGMSGVQGSFDQLLYLSEPISDNSLLKVFSGFLPITYATSTGYTLTYQNQERRNIPYENGIDWSTINYNPFVNTMGIINNHIISSNYLNANGVYLVNFSGASAAISGEVSRAIDLCNTTNQTAFLSTSQNVSNTNGIVAAVDVVKFSKNEYNEFVFTHSWRVTRSGITGYVDHDFYQVYSNEVVTGMVTDTGYYSSFNMKGIVNRNTGNRYLKLEIPNSYSFLKPTGMNNWGLLDSVNTNYYVNGLTTSGQIYYGDSGKLNPLDYSIANGRANPQQINTSYNLIYDMRAENSAVSQQTTSAVATGDFPPYGSLAFDSSQRRIIFQNYYETSSLHLIHGEGFNYPSTPNSIYNNDSRFWS